MSFLMRLLLLATLLMMGCHRHADTPGIDATLTISPDPPKVGKAKLILELASSDGSPISGASLELEGNMHHAGMKPVFATPTEGKDGVYHAELEFTMGGDWFILVTGKQADGQPIRKRIDVKGVRSR